MHAHLVKVVSTLIALAGTLMTPSVIAGPIYEFIDTDGVSLAEIELHTLPAGLGDILSYRFTASGDAIFHLGLGPQAFSEFSPFWGTALLDDGLGGLMGSATYSPGEVLSTLVTTANGFYTGFFGLNADFIRSSPDAFATTTRGNYVLKTAVSEPSSWAIFGIGLLVLVVARKAPRIERLRPRFVAR